MKTNSACCVKSEFEGRIYKGEFREYEEPVELIRSKRMLDPRPNLQDQTGAQHHSMRRCQELIIAYYTDDPNFGDFDHSSHLFHSGARSICSTFRSMAIKGPTHTGDVVPSEQANHSLKSAVELYLLHGVQ